MQRDSSSGDVHRCSTGAAVVAVGIVVAAVILPYLTDIVVAAVACCSFSIEFAIKKPHSK